MAQIDPRQAAKIAEQIPLTALSWQDGRIAV